MLVKWRWRWMWMWVAALAAIVLYRPVSAIVAPLYDAVSRSGGAAVVVNFSEPGWHAETLRELPERVTAITSYSDPSGDREEQVFVGTAPTGRIYLFLPRHAQSLLFLASGLGDQPTGGTCEISCIAVADFDGDGTPELLAQTSQVDPMGCPRLYAWSLQGPPLRFVPFGVARPEIKSSWSHGLGVWRASGTDKLHVFSTFCGFGEIVEYSVARGVTENGFHDKTIAWRQIGQLPASGEDTTVADADNDGAADLCLATGYSLGRAAIVIYPLGERGVAESPRHAIDEQGRFGNVRFLVADLGRDGVSDIVAWWCTDLSTGDCEIIRYRLGLDGICERVELARGDAGSLWPRDGQFTLADTDGDGWSEVWFVTGSGNLSCYEPGRSPAVSRVAVIHGDVGPLARGRGERRDRDGLYVGCDRFVLRLARETRAAPLHQLAFAIPPHQEFRPMPGGASE